MPRDVELDKEIREIIVTRVLTLDATVHGIVTGLIFGLLLFASTMWLVIKGGDVVGPHLTLLGQFFIGYRVTFFGSFIGLAYGALSGFVLGFTVATIYNKITLWRNTESEK